MLDKMFNPKEAESRIYDMWESSGAFKPRMDSSREAYSIVIPPPNVTGTLHMGHAVNNTIQDILIRFERMRGKDVLWQPGMDHAGIATQMVVERNLAASGNESRAEMGREAFLKKVWEWKSESGGQIEKQLRRLGSSCDWSRSKFTLGDPDDPHDTMVQAVTKAFVDMYEAGLIYRDKRLVNWDPHFQTAISNLEVENKEVDGHFWHFKYPLADGETYTYIEKDEDGTITLQEERDYISIATTRPETMLGDGAVAVHPKDERYTPIVGKMVRLPLANRLIPIITDIYPDPNFGSGAVKITGAHDFNDYQVAKRNDIPMYPLMGTRGEMIASEIMPEKYVGMDRFATRKAVVADIDAEGLLIKVEDKKIQQPMGDRSGVVIEPMLTDQWFVDAETLAKVAMAKVDDGTTRFVPANWKNTYDHWMKNIEPWCISRQLWWGHRVPAWYDEVGKIIVAEDEKAAQAKYADMGGAGNLTQDEDVLDTWFSSGLWPFSTLGWPNKAPELERFYPTSALVTGNDIIFFWVARMMMQGLHFMKDIPFKDVYIHAIVRDEDGRKMSKSEGNVIDPVDLIDGIDIESLVVKRTKGLRQPEKAPRVERETRKRYPEGFEPYGADALRFTLCAQAAAGRDIKLSVERVAGYRNFGTKLWSAANFGQMNACKYDPNIGPETFALPLNQWIVDEAYKASHDVAEYIQSYRFSDAADAAYKFTWDTFCAWYLELCKPILSENTDTPARRETRSAFGWALDHILKMLHPIMPFITEELWQKTGEERDSMLILAPWPERSSTHSFEQVGQEITRLQNIISSLRSVRSDMNVPPSRKAPLIVTGTTPDDPDRHLYQTYAANLDMMGRVSEVVFKDNLPDGALQIVADDTVLGVMIADLIDIEAERERLSKDMAKIDEEIAKIDKKLSNQNFVERAPAAVVDEQKTRREKFESERKKLLQALDNLPGAKS